MTNQNYTTEHYLMTEHTQGTAGVARLYSEDPNSAAWRKRAQEKLMALLILMAPEQVEIFGIAWNSYALSGATRTWQEACDQWHRAAEMLQAGEQLTTILEELGLLEGQS